MDGWAVAGEYDGYRLVGESRAGHAYGDALDAGEAVAISTGAVVPQGATAVVRREKAEATHDRLTIRDYREGRDIRARGCDFLRGATLATQGERLDHFAIARLAAGGFGQTPVYLAPSIALLATGDEIVPAGKPALEGQNYDALTPAIEARLTSCRFAVHPLGRVPDCDGAILEAVRGMDAGLVIITGGASGGKHDRVRQALDPLGLKVIVPKIAMRPGKPFWFGKLADGRLVFGLPGNPVAALLCLELFVLPALWTLAGERERPSWRPAAIAGDAPSPKAGYSDEKLVFSRTGSDGIRPLGGQDSAALMPLSGIDSILRTSAAERPLIRLLNIEAANPIIAHANNRTRGTAMRVSHEARSARMAKPISRMWWPRIKARLFPIGVTCTFCGFGNNGSAFGTGHCACCNRPL